MNLKWGHNSNKSATILITVCLLGPEFYSCSILFFTVSNDFKVNRRYGYVIKSWDFSINKFEGLAGSSTSPNSRSIAPVLFI